MDLDNWCDLWRDLFVAASLLAAANEDCCPQDDKNQDNRSQRSCVIGCVKFRVGLGCNEVQLVKQVCCINIVEASCCQRVEGSLHLVGGGIWEYMCDIPSPGENSVHSLQLHLFLDIGNQEVLLQLNPASISDLQGGSIADIECSLAILTDLLSGVVSHGVDTILVVAKVQDGLLFPLDPEIALRPG